ncbi:hypothetical protein Tco_0558624 [Tanacetum coccineum]
MRVREKDISKTASETRIWTFMNSMLLPFAFDQRPAVFMRPHERQEHEEPSKLILEVVKKEELYAKFPSVNFGFPKLPSSVTLIDNKGIQCGSCMIESVKDWHLLRHPTEFRVLGPCWERSFSITYCDASKKVGRCFDAERKSDLLCISPVEDSSRMTLIQLMHLKCWFSGVRAAQDLA